jgi:hypothetical protein
MRSITWIEFLDSDVATAGLPEMTERWNSTPPCGKQAVAGETAVL